MVLILGIRTRFKNIEIFGQGSKDLIVSDGRAKLRTPHQKIAKRKEAKMGWIIGDWRILKEGEVDQVLKKCIKLLLKHKFTLRADLIVEKRAIAIDSRPIEYRRALYEILRNFERRHGVNNLLEVLTAGGLKLKCNNNQDEIIIEVLLRTPSDSEESSRLFKDMVTEWIEQNTLTFCQRFFRLPKIREDVVDRYLDNPFERSLKKIFGFHFQYKVMIKYEGTSLNFEDLRKRLYRALT